MAIKGGQKEAKKAWRKDRERKGISWAERKQHSKELSAGTKERRY